MVAYPLEVLLSSRMCTSYMWIPVFNSQHKKESIRLLVVYPKEAKSSCNRDTCNLKLT